MKHESLLDRLMEQPLAEARQKAREEARQEGIQKGRELGMRENALDNLLEVLDVRFHEQDVALYTPIFEAITDVQLLRQLLHTALRVPTFDDVMQTLKDYRKNNGPNTGSPERNKPIARQPPGETDVPRQRRRK